MHTTAQPTTASLTTPARTVAPRWRLAAGAAAALMLLSACSQESGHDAAATSHNAPASALADAGGAGFANQRQVAPQMKSANMAKEKQARMAPQAEMAMAAAPSAAPVAAPAPASASGSVSEGDTTQAASQRFLAIRHDMQIEAPAAELAGLWESVKTTCERLDCQVEASALQRETPRTAATAYLTMRVNPRDFAALTGALGSAKVLNHQTASEDKTSEVVDVEARIKNRSDYRDSLRELLREKGVKRTLSDLMEIRDTLSNVQAEIDAAQTQRKLLERETAKQLVQMRFQPQQVIISGTYSPWMQTWKQSWSTMTYSAQALIVTAAGALPWLLVLGLVIGWPLARLCKKWGRKRAAAQAARGAGGTPAAQVPTDK